MPATQYYTATTIDGFNADADNSLDGLFAVGGRPSPVRAPRSHSPWRNRLGSGRASSPWASAISMAARTTRWRFSSPSGVAVPGCRGVRAPGGAVRAAGRGGATTEPTRGCARTTPACAGVAGPALAYWLHRHGCTPTVVERAPSLRAGGHAVDVRGVALEVIERTGLTDPLRRARTRMRGMSMRDPHGAEIMRSTEMALSSGRLDSDDVEVLREDLIGMLHDVTRPHTRYLFGDAVTTLGQDRDGVRVTFGDAAPETFDLVVGADGLHSTVRRLAFGPEQP